VCEIDGKVALVDFKTNATLDAALIEAYSLQLRIYGVAARRGLLPGGREPRLILFDMRRGELLDVRPDDDAVMRRITEASARITANDFHLGPEHADRPCRLCAFRPICPDARLPRVTQSDARLPRVTQSDARLPRVTQSDARPRP